MEKPIHMDMGTVVQLDPQKIKNPMFAACFLTVSEVKSWGVQGYVQSLGNDGKMGGQAYYRANWDEIEPIGQAVWTVGLDDPNEQEQEDV